MLSIPNVSGVRLANPEDLHRISLVAAAAFFSSPTFRFQRPRYKEFPADTVASFEADYAAEIGDPASVVLVVEDTLRADETKHVYEALQGVYGTTISEAKGIVGVCSFTLKPKSCYMGRFQPAGWTDACTQRVMYNWKRDQCIDARNVYDTATGPAKLKHLAGKMRLNTLAVAPAHQLRGHAGRLVSFCTQLADLDEALLGVSATPSGAAVAAKAGFEERDYIRIKRLAAHEAVAREDPPDAADVKLWIGVRPPCSRSTSPGSAGRSESPMENQSAE